MGRSSDWAIEIAEENYREQKEDWIRRELNDPDAEECTAGWQELEETYDERYTNWYDYIEDEYEWHVSQGHSEHYFEFLQTIDDIKNILKSEIDPFTANTVYKMLHIHAVTAMETYLGDTLKSAVLSDNKYIQNAARNLDELTRRKFTLEQILAHDDGVKKIVLDQFYKYLYHNVPKVMMIYTATLGININYDFEELCKITKIRHDMVHRNGKGVIVKSGV